MSKRIIVKPGVSILAIDPGTTTGLAVWDPWDGQLYVDHVDAGRGRKVRYKVHGGFVESASRRAAELALADPEDRDAVRAGRGLRKGKQGYMETTSIVERGVVRVIGDILMALGPRTLVVIEDFVLGAAGGTPSGKRDGLSPVRIANRLDQMLWDQGFVSGDVWREWQGHPWMGADPRGWTVNGEIPDFYTRYTKAEMYRLHGNKEEDEAVWGGAGVMVKWRMPAGRAWLKGGVRECDEWMRENGYWKPGRRHAMDALQHLIVAVREMGVEVPAGLESIWFGGSVPNGKGVSAKRTRPAPS